MNLERFQTRSLQDPRVLRILQQCIHAVEPEALVAERLHSMHLPDHRQLFLLGIGKAAESMTRAAARSLPGFDAALVVTKKRVEEDCANIRVLEGGHPVPDERSLEAGKAVLRFASQTKADDLLICLISGGGSALAVAPWPGVSLRDLQSLTKAALASGARIEDVNALRRRLDKIKSGGLARTANARILAFILSDVVGDQLDAVASGPTLAGPTGDEDLRAILDAMRMPVPSGIREMLRRRDSGTPTPEATAERVTNVMIGNNELALDAAATQAKLEGFDTQIVDRALSGEASQVGRSLARTLAERARSRTSSLCLLAGGETTVSLSGSGFGGRCQEMALASVGALDGRDHCMLITMASDGNDGPTDAAGAVVTGSTRRQAAALGMDAQAHLATHDSYPYFDALGDLLRPGYTGTNVNDIVLMLWL